MEGETATPTKTTTSLIGSNWPSLPIPDDPQVSEDSPIQPAQQSPTAWKGQQRGPDEYEKDRVGRFAKYFKGNEILPIPEIAEKIAPRVLSLVVSDLKTKRLVGLTKDVFEELLRKAGIPCQYFCRKSFATWDVLLPTEKQAAKTAGNKQLRSYTTDLFPHTTRVKDSSPRLAPVIRYIKRSPQLPTYPNSEKTIPSPRDKYSTWTL